MIKVISTKSDSKIVFRTPVATADLSDEGLSANTEISISMNLTTPMVEFPGGIIIGLDFNAFIHACVEKYKSLQEDINNV